MSIELTYNQSAAHAVLVQRREELTGLRATLSERSATVNRLRSELRVFEDRYFREAGMLYAELDLLEACIAEREVDLYDSSEARQRASAARQHAEESRKAADEHEAETIDFAPPVSLRTLFRDVAKRIHPDLAQDVEEAQYFTLLMSRANRAYRQGDIDTLQRMFEEHQSVVPVMDEDEVERDTARILRQIQHARRDLAEVDLEHEALRTSEIAQLHEDSQLALREGRDLIAALALTLQERVTDARRRLELIDRQITAHGR